MPAGNVAGLIDLEGEPAEAFGGGEDGTGGRVGSGSERVARLSDGVAGSVALPWGCKARVAAGNVVLAHWKVGTLLPCIALRCLEEQTMHAAVVLSRLSLHTLSLPVLALARVWRTPQPVLL